MKKKDKIKLLKPFWKQREKAYHEFIVQETKIEEEMNRKLSKKFKIPIEFFYIDGCCVGIGATDYKDRKKFRLIHDSELWDYGPEKTT